MNNLSDASKGGEYARGSVERSRDLVDRGQQTRASRFHLERHLPHYRRYLPHFREHGRHRLTGVKADAVLEAHARPCSLSWAQVRGAIFEYPGPRRQVKGRTRSGRGFSAYQPETIEAPIDYALLLKHAVEVQLEQAEDDWARLHGTVHTDPFSHHQSTPYPRPSRPPSPLTPPTRGRSPPAPPPPPSPPPSRTSTVYVMELDELVSGIAQTEAASSNAAGRKRPASAMNCGLPPPAFYHEHHSGEPAKCALCDAPPTVPDGAYMDHDLDNEDEDWEYPRGWNEQ
ncbi:unnamed protein product [Peniophora sp. CBMAI 1063]|nr:unnamed protein product [Peniophora sp. CBMAI 1063]